MNPEDIKVGETYNVRMNFQRIDEDGDFCFRVFDGDDRLRFLKRTQVERAVYPLSDMANGTKNADPAPKYDPCRLFREGDEVRPIVHKGRIFSLYWREYIGKTFIVTKSEDAFDLPEVNGQPIDPAYLELVTPVEERVTYRVGDFAVDDEWCVWKDQGGRTKKVCSYNVNTHPHAKEAAEAERDRLNEEWRKEQSNG